MSKVGFLITGRMKSTRLKEKLTLEILEKEVITHMINRAKEYFDHNNIVIATSINAQDNILEEIAIRENINVFRGDEEDVIKRLYEAAEENNFDYFINITADCPLFGFDYVDKLMKIMLDDNADLVTSLDLPHGIFIYALKTSSLKKVLEIKKTIHTEVWGDYYYNNPNLFKVSKYTPNESEIRPDYRLTLDYPEDFEFFKKVYEHFGHNTYKTSSKDIIHFLDKNPDIVNINKHCKALYSKRWDSQRVSKIEENE